MTILERANIVTPVQARLFAKRNGVALTSRQIQAVSKLTLRTINQISRKTTWADVTIDRRERFLKACGITESNSWRVNEWLLRSAKAPKGFRHIRKLIAKNSATTNGATSHFFSELLQIHFNAPNHKRSRL